ncbi:MAG: heliorhodopsin HeR [Chloroflexi bacterium]|nr:heliorhodopsin HeR [Chloroflexota bacterium]
MSNEAIAQAGAVTPVQQSRLRRTNISLSFLHLAQGIVILILGSGFSALVTASYIGSSVEYRYEPRIMLAVFLFISAFCHLLVSLPKVFPWYIRNLGRHINYVRWYEYSLSASVMIVLIASLCGITDLVSLLGLFVLTAGMNLFGLMMELHNQSTAKTNWTAFIFGSIVGVVPWAAIILYFVKSTPAPPTFVYAVIVSLMVLYAMFPLNMWLQYTRKGRWRNYVWGEYGYMFLSLTAKSLLAWQVFAGTLNAASWLH